MKETLARSARPRTFDAIIGQDAVIKKIRQQYKNGRLPNCWMFYGSTGAGKTTLARVLAVSLQCTHQEEFGNPCAECWKRYAEFPIHEINAAEVNKREDIEPLVKMSQYALLENTRHVYIFDEAHGLSASSQNLLLKRFEDTKYVTWILCTTEPNGIKATLRRRCGAGTFRLKPFDDQSMTLLVKRLLKKAKSDLASDVLVDALLENEVRSPGLIADAVDNYTGGSEPDEAVSGAVVTGLDTKRLCRAVVSGNWVSTSKFLRQAQNGDARALRAAVIGYLRVMLLDSAEYDKRTDTIAKAIKQLGYLSFAEDLVQITTLASELYTVCRMFSR